MPTCALCEREVKKTTVHHLTPKQKDRRRTRDKLADDDYTIELCRACHKQIHSLFTNNELKRDHNTLEKLKANEDVKKFVQWVRKRRVE